MCLQYDFFKSALEDSAVALEQYNELGEHITYAKFFIAATLNELGDKDSFESLIENNKLDILINLGITHATDDAVIISMTVDKYLNKFNKKNRTNNDMSSYIFNLYDKSTEELSANHSLI